jgi:dTDP-4-amino-4,6-dideoxygalactose transaminase
LEWNRIRQELSTVYRQMLSRRAPTIEVPFGTSYETAAHLMPVILPKGLDRALIMENLRKNEVQSSIHYPPVHRFSFYQDHFPKTVLPKTEEFSLRELTLPLHPSLQEKDIVRVVELFIKTVAEQSENCN